jgi:hypothetical protein
MSSINLKNVEGVMKKAFITIAACSLMMLLTGCGVKFIDRNINLKLSDEMLGTSLFKDTEILKRHLEDIPGYIAVDDGSGTLQAVFPLQTNGYKPSVTPIRDDKAFYHSVIDQSAGIQGSYLAILSADLGTKHTAEVTITETAEAYIPKENVPWQAIAQWAKTNPPRPGEKRFYVQGALLSTVSKTTYVEISANATVDGGTAFGAKGKVYATDKTTQTSNYAFIGTHLIDVDKIPYTPPGVMRLLKMEEEYKAKVKVGKIYKSNWPKPK